jgi:iron(III) transport system permease protein
VPELRPALIGAAILTFMTSMASFSAPFLFGGEHRFMTTEIYASKLNGELDLAATQSIALTLVSVAFFILLSSAGRQTMSSRRTKGAVAPRPLVVSRPVRLILLVVTFALFLVELLPILTILLISFVREGSWTWQVFPSEFTFSNYFKLFSDPRIFEPVRNSIAMGALTVVASLLVGVVAAYVVAKGGLRRGRLLLDVALMLPYAIPGTVIAIGMILAFNMPSLITGYTVLVGSFWILPLAYFVRTYPLVVRSTAASLERLDDGLIEAAETFGAGMFRRFRRIALPLILPGIVSGCLLVMIAALGEFVSSILLYTYGSRPISIEILSQLRGYNFGSAAAYCVLLLVLIMALIGLSNSIVRRFGPGGAGLEF